MLELKNVSVEFASKNSVRAVDGVSMTLKDGSRTAIVGETGSGKSILMLSIMRLLASNAVVTGEILLDGEDILKADRKRLQQIRGGIISYVPQGGGASMNPLLKVGFQVGEPLMEHKGYSRQDAEKESVSLLKRFNLGNEERMAQSYPHVFSGGMRQRAMVAMGISAGARIILADEPTKGLDEKRVALVADTFERLRDETLLVVTHDMNFARRIADDIFVMYSSQQVEYAPAEKIMSEPLHPYTRDMISAMPENGMKYDDRGFAPSHEDVPTGCRYAQRCHECTARCSEMPPVTDLDGHKVRCWKYAV
ncbi:MAG: ABC transporter ATP-binding protein [Eubacteriaceae bacterium]|nr:ABC transporter ATP-binding protein [Eubacteriaceae bacterium]